MTEIAVTFDGRDIPAELDADTGCLRLEVGGHSLHVRRAEVRAALHDAASYVGDRGMWWDGYEEALNDIERKFGDDEGVTLWLLEVRRKFGIVEADADHA